MLLKTKKGRPMADSNVIFDEVTSKVYDPNIDPLEYKKARKYMSVFLIFIDECRIEKAQYAVDKRKKKASSILNQRTTS
jgi:hypothetical protein